MKTEIIVVLDRSGSMSPIAGDTVGGLNTFIESQRKSAPEAVLTILQFDTEFDYIRKAVPIKDVQSIGREEYVPRGGTALHDAICMAIDDAGRRFEKDPPQGVFFAILTDGLENASTRFKRDQVREKIEHQTKNYQWQFIYLGANQDAILTGEQLGVGAGNSANYMASPRGVAVAASAMDGAFVSYSCSNAGVPSANLMAGKQHLGETAAP